MEWVKTIIGFIGFMSIVFCIHAIFVSGENRGFINTFKYLYSKDLSHE